MTKQPRVLVTGATGFVGHHLCELLMTRGYQVRGTFRTQYSGASLPKNIDWIRIDTIGPDTEWSKALDSVDYVVHLAALAHQIGPKGEGRAEEFVRVNALGTQSLARAVAASPTVRRLVFVSSIGAVRSVSSSQITATSICEPDTDYGRSKLLAEQYVRDALESGDPDWCIIRPVLVYGPGNPGNMDRLLRLIQTRIPLPLDAIKNRRSFIYIGNLVNLLVECLEHPEASGQVFLANDGKDMSTPDLVRRIAQVSGQKVVLFPLPIAGLRLLGRFGDWVQHFTGRSMGLDTYSVDRLIGSLWVDSSPLGDLLDWNPPFSVDSGLRYTLGKSNRAIEE